MFSTTKDDILASIHLLVLERKTRRRMTRKTPSMSSHLNQSQTLQSVGRKSWPIISLVKPYRRSSFTAASSRFSALTASSGSRRTSMKCERNEAQERSEAYFGTTTSCPQTIIERKPILVLCARIKEDCLRMRVSKRYWVMMCLKILVKCETESRSTGAKTRLTTCNKDWKKRWWLGRARQHGKRESKVLLRYTNPPVLAYALQYPLNAASILSAGYLRKVGLGADSLGSICQGLATSLVAGYTVSTSL